LTDIYLTVTAFTILRGFLGVKWFSVIGIAYNLMCPLFSDIPKHEVGSKVVKWGVKSLTLHYK